jgi:glycerophosphoryl diester phosphodiesterase
MSRSTAQAFIRPGQSRPLIYGHRGMRGAPENTLPAFALALDAGADGIELDVRVCKSGEVVVMHDPDLVRMAGLDQQVADLTWSELRRVELFDPRSASGQASTTPATTPLLRDVLDYVLGRGALLNVEIKSDVPDLDVVVNAVASDLNARSKYERERLLVSSFHPLALLGFRAHAPDIALGFLLGEEQYEAYAPRLPSYGEHPRASLCTAEALARYRTRAEFINVWTVNNAEQARSLAALGVDGLITDVSDRLRALF